MARHYIVCDCGHKNYYDKPFERPAKCEKCHRSLFGKVALEVIGDPDIAPIGNQIIDDPTLKVGDQIGEFPLDPEKGRTPPSSQQQEIWPAIGIHSDQQTQLQGGEMRAPEQQTGSAPSYGEAMLTLESPDGRIRLVIPKEGAVIGRGTNSLGSKELRSDEAISREHLKVRYQMTMGLIIEDISRFGTFVNGQKLQKGKPQFVPVGTTIYLYDFPMVVRKR